jgi:pimeloyl-ACP methyl ester carboxylesterase
VGFLDIWATIRADAVKLVTSALGLGCNNIVVVGHSLGGAIATLAGFELAASLSTLGIPVIIQTTGSPRVGSCEYRCFVRK